METGDDGQGKAGNQRWDLCWVRSRGGWGGTQKLVIKIKEVAKKLHNSRTWEPHGGHGKMGLPNQQNGLKSNQTATPARPYAPECFSGVGAKPTILKGNQVNDPQEVG